MKRRAILLAAAVMTLTAAPGVASEESQAPATAPVPLEKPDPEDRLDALEAEAPADAARTQADDLKMPDLLRETDADFAACRAVLDEIGTVYETAPAIVADDPDCGVARPVLVTEIVPGVTLNPDSRMRCETALALAEWTRDFVLPAAKALPERGRLTALEHGSTYVCRRRNNLPTGKLSEHAFGNAVDIMGFRFSDGPVLRVEPREADGTVEEAFQRTVRAAACLSFTTVLGPGTDAAHADHVHMDVKERRGGYRLCQ